MSPSQSIVEAAPGSLDLQGRNPEGIVTQDESAQALPSPSQVVPEMTAAELHKKTHYKKMKELCKIAHRI